MILKITKKNRRGISIVELILTILFASIAFPLILYALSSILEKITIKNEWAQKATFLASAKMEQIIADPASAGDEDIYNPDNYYPGYKQSNASDLPGGVGGNPGPGPQPSFVKQYKIQVITETIDDAVADLNISFNEWNPSTNRIGGEIKGGNGQLFKPALKFTRYKVVVSRYSPDGSLAPLAQLALVR